MILEQTEEKETDVVGGLFTISKQKQKEKVDKSVANGLDCSRFTWSAPGDWSIDDVSYLAVEEKLYIVDN